MTEIRSGEANRVVTGKEDWEETVRLLLSPPGLYYMRELGRILERDPDYLLFHAGTVTLRINEILSRARPGVARVTEENVGTIVRAVVQKLRTVR